MASRLLRSARLFYKSNRRFRSPSRGVAVCASSRCPGSFGPDNNYNRHMKSSLFCGTIVALLAAAAVAEDAGKSTDEAKLKPLVDVRARWENVDQDGIAEEAEAGTLRARLGFETAKFLSTSLLAEGEFIWA